MSIAQRVKLWASNAALPLWSEQGVDRKHGGFVESLDMEGQANVLHARRVRTQARQIFSFAHAYNVGWASDYAVAIEGLAYLTDKAWMVGGVPGWAQCLDETGRVTNPVRDLYDHACVLLALAAAFKASGDAHCLELADQTLVFLDETLAEKSGGFAENPERLLPRRQNPHMHLFEAFLVLYEVSGNINYLRRADDIHALFDRVFFDPDAKMLREYFTGNWEGWAQGGRDIWEPGHHGEWVWLLKKYANFKRLPVHVGAKVIFDKIVLSGINPKTGLLFGQMGSEDSIHEAPSRTWMQTEYIKALLARHEEGDGSAAHRVEQAVDTLFKYHLDPAISGSWVDQIDHAGLAVSDHAPASSLYHLLYCMTEIERVLGSN